MFCSIYLPPEQLLCSYEVLEICVVHLHYERVAVIL
jgi:hypothetical protein